MTLNYARVGKWLGGAPILASLCASFTFALANWAVGFGAPNPDTWSFSPSPIPLISVTLFLWLFAGILAIIANATLGVAWQVIAHRFRVRSLIAHLSAGAVCGMAFSAMILWEPLSWSFGDGRPLHLLPITSFGVLIGILTALFTWLIRRPDRDAPNPATLAP
jgi:hypothetical protein